MTSTEDTPVQPKNVGLRTAVFVGLMAAVVGGFFYLEHLEEPPGLPSDAVHKYSVDERNKKASVAEINTRCQSCHGTAGVDPKTHACGKTGTCLPTAHTQYTQCIKCHRPGRTTPSERRAQANR